MPISWKKSKNLKPAIILDRIESFRTVSPEGRASFAGFEVHNALPALQSMLDFPASTSDVQKKSILVWKSVASIKGKLSPESFIAAINHELAAQSATREAQYHILTSVSLNPNG